MTEKVDVFMPLFVGDYLADTTDLTTEEHGAYLLLLMNLWKRGGRLPCEPERLARIVGLSIDEWELVWIQIGRFFDLEDGHITQRRLAREIDRAKAQKDRAVDRGRKGAALRWAKTEHGQSNGQSNGASIAQALDKRCSPPSPSHKEDPPIVPQGDDFDFDPEFDRFWAVTNKRGSKFKAHKSWLKLKKPPADQLIASWKLWEKTREWRDGFQKHPVTWLNGRMHLQTPPVDQSDQNNATRSQVQEMIKRQQEKSRQQELVHARTSGSST